MDKNQIDQPEGNSQEQNSVDTPTVSSSAPDQNFSLSSPKKSKLPLIITIVMLLLLAAGANWYFMARAKEHSLNLETKYEYLSADEDYYLWAAKHNFREQLAQVTAELKNEHAGNIDLVKTNSGDNNSGITFYSEADNTYYRVVSPDGWSGLVSGKNNSNYFPSFVAKVKNLGFSDSKFTSHFDEEGEVNAYLEKDDILCKLSKFSLDRAFYTCVDKTEAPKYLATTLPFAEAFERDAKPDSEFVVSVREEKIVDSVDGDYKIAKGGIGYLGSGGHANFYKKKTESTWHYAYGGHTTPMCEQFSKSIDMRKAFIDVDCDDEPQGGAATTVRKYFKM